MFIQLVRAAHAHTLASLMRALNLAARVSRHALPHPLMLCPARRCLLCRCLSATDILQLGDELLDGV